MKRNLVKYYLLFLLLIPELKALAQFEHNYRSGAEALKQSELFPNKFIRSRNKYIFNKKRLGEKGTCLILAEKNDKEINLELHVARRNRKAGNITYIMSGALAITGIGFSVSSIIYEIDHTHYQIPSNGAYISKEDLAYSQNLRNIGLTISMVSATSFIIATTFGVKSRSTLRDAVWIYNQKY
jgi:hypothetical protein